MPMNNMSPLHPSAGGTTGGYMWGEFAGLMQQPFNPSDEGRRPYEPMHPSADGMFGGLLRQPFRPSSQMPTSGVPRVPASGPLGSQQNPFATRTMSDLLRTLQGSLFGEWSQWFWATTPGPTGWEFGSGWTKCPTPDCASVWGAPDWGVWGTATTCSAQPDCPTGQAGGVFGSTRLPWGTVHPTRRLVLGYKHTSGNTNDSSFRGTIVTQFVRASSSEVEVPDYVSQEFTTPWSGEAPESWAEPDPEGWGEDWFQPDEYYGPGYRTPAEQIFITPEGVYDGPTTTHREVPDNSRKARYLQWASRVFGTMTEIGDFFEALADALPDDRCKNKGIYDTAACVLENWDEIDPLQAGQNLVVNQIEDAIVGRTLGALQNAGRNLGAGGLTGFELGNYLNTALDASFSAQPARARRLPQRKMGNV